jgi:hypothetical protein
MSEQRSWFIASLFINIAGWFVVHHLTKKREKQRDIETRRRDLMAYMIGWRSQIEMGVPGSNPANMSEFITRWFTVKVSEFQSKVPQVDLIFRDGAKFKTLTDRLACLSEKDWKGRNAKDVILASMDELIEFCRQPTK